MKKMVSLVLAALLSASALAGCSSGQKVPSPSEASSQAVSKPASSQAPSEATPSGEKTLITFATGADENWKRTLDYVIGNANAALEDVEIVAEYSPSEEEIWKVLPAQIVSGSAPDIVGLNNEGVLELIANGTLAPLDDLAAEVGFDLSALDHANVDGWRYQEKLYGVPLTSTVSAYAVNMSLLKAAGIEKAPSTMEEVVAAAQAVNDPENGIYGVCVNIHEFHVSQYTHAFGGDWAFGEEINSEGNKQGLQFVVDLFNKHKVAATPAQMGVNGDTDAFASGKAAMTTGGPWYVPTLQDRNVDFEWTIVPIPSGTEQKTTVYGWAFNILEASENKNAAMRAIQAMLVDDNFRYLVEERGDIPSNTSFVPAYEEKYPEMAAVLATAGNGLGFNYPIAANRFKSDLVTGLESVIFQGSSTVEELLAKMAGDGYKS